MSKKPALHVVGTPALTGPPPPPNLGEHGGTLWRAVTTEYDIADTGGREMLRQACASLDRAEACADAIREDGEVIRTKAGPKAHPLLKARVPRRQAGPRPQSRHPALAAVAG